MKAQVEAAIRQGRLVAILRGVPPAHVAEMGEALLAGGIRVMEVALSTPDAPEALQRLRLAVGERGWVGAGTVISSQVGRLALDCGAQFFVTPHVVPDVLELAGHHSLAVVCGAITPTEIAHARALGSTLVKLFPASAVGPGFIKALRGPYPDLELLAVGGIGPANLAEYMNAGALGGGIGGALTDLNWAQPDFERTVRLATDLVRIAAGT